MKFVLGTIAAAMLIGVAFTQPAEARCMWDGFAMRCWHSHFYDRDYYRDHDFYRPHHRDWGWYR
jgi:hypothetical protein